MIEALGGLGVAGGVKERVRQNGIRIKGYISMFTRMQ